MILYNINYVFLYYFLSLYNIVKIAAIVDTNINIIHNSRQPVDILQAEINEKMKNEKLINIRIGKNRIVHI